MALVTPYVLEYRYWEKGGVASGSEAVPTNRGLMMWPVHEDLLPTRPRVRLSGVYTATGNTTIRVREDALGASTPTGNLVLEEVLPAAAYPTPFEIETSTALVLSGLTFLKVTQQNGDGELAWPVLTLFSDPAPACGLPFKLDELEFPNSRTLRVRFTNSIAPASVLTSNFTISPSTGAVPAVLVASRPGGDPECVDLTVASDLQDAVWTVTVSELVVSTHGVVVQAPLSIVAKKLTLLQEPISRGAV